jgi:hypothetical protein
MDKRLKLIRLAGRIGIPYATKLREIVGKFEYDYAITLGQDSINDGKASDYYWNPTNMDNDNGTTVIKPNVIANNFPGRWLRVIIPSGSQITLPRQKIINFNMGNTSTTTITRAHGLGNFNMLVQVYEEKFGSPTAYRLVDVDIQITTVNIILTVVTPFSLNTNYRIIVQEINI